MLKAYVSNDQIPKSIQEEIGKQPITHLLSTYVVRPIAFTKNPFFLPPAAVKNKINHNKHF